MTESNRHNRAANRGAAVIAGGAATVSFAASAMATAARRLLRESTVRNEATWNLDSQDHKSAQVLQFTAQRIRYDSLHDFDTVLTRLHAELGDKGVDLKAINVETTTWKAYQEKVRAYVGPAGFMLFAILDYGSWIRKAGIERRELRLILGNPLIAITMIRYDLSAALFVPVEILLTESVDRTTCSVTYITPSSLIVIDESRGELLSAAMELDAKLSNLVKYVCA